MRGFKFITENQEGMSKFKYLGS